MSAQAALARPAKAPWPLLALGSGGLAFAGAAALLGGEGILEIWYVAFVAIAGVVIGSLGLLMIGHVMTEEWLRPVRSEAEAAALTALLLPLLALPLAFHLPELYPWARGMAADLPGPRATYLSPAFFLARGALYLALLIVLALWIVRTPRPRRTGAIGLALLAPAALFAGSDWVLSREPQWWSGLFGFAFSLSQLLAALAGGILVSLLRPEHPSAARMQSLERALLTLALLVLWTWFVHFLVVWLANLPHEAAWYLSRADAPWRWLMTGIALPALIAAVVVLAPPGVGRRSMIAGSALLLAHHGAHMLWLLRPAARLDLAGILAGLGLMLAWGAFFAAALKTRPHDEAGDEAAPSGR